MLSILIPVWNQGKKIKDNFLNLNDTLKEIEDEYEIIFIDDGSCDNTFEVIKNIYQNHSGIRAIRLGRNIGQHQALFEGFKIAKGDVIITMDADAKVPPSYIPELMSKMKEGYDIVVAWRHYRPGLIWIRKLGSFLINAYTNFITGHKLHDHACSLKGYSGQLIKENLSCIELRRFFGIMVIKYAKRVGEIKVECLPKYYHESSLGWVGLILLALDFIASHIKKNRNYSSFKIIEVLN